MCSAHTPARKFVAQVNAVRHVDRESDRPATVAVFVPMGDDVANQFGAIHAVGEFHSTKSPLQTSRRRVRSGLIGA